MWKVNKKPVTLQVTKDLANEFANMEPAPLDRPLSERRIAVYRRLLEQGGFRPCTWAKAYCKETGSTYRVNGKHTSTLLSSLEVLPQFYVTIEEYECESLDDVARLYSTFDSKLMARSAGDINHSFAGTVPQLRDMPLRLINVAVAGMAYHLYNTGAKYVSMQAAEKAELLLEHTDFVVWLKEMIGGGVSEQRGHRSKCPHLQRQPVVAAMMGTWLRHTVEATKFWTAVRDETGTDPKMPDRVLSRWLLTNVIKEKGKAKTHHREVYVKCLHGWNAWRNKESTKLQYFADADVPKIK